MVSEGLVRLNTYYPWYVSFEDRCASELVTHAKSPYHAVQIKILAVIVYIIVGIFISAGVIGGEVYGFKYWNDPGAFTPNKAHILNAIVLASLTMQGTEIVGVTAAEADNPSKVSFGENLS